MEKQSTQTPVDEDGVKEPEYDTRDALLSAIKILMGGKTSIPIDSLLDSEVTKNMVEEKSVMIFIQSLVNDNIIKINGSGHVFMVQRDV